MKKISTLLLSAFTLLLFLCTGCGKSNEFTVKGIVSGADGQTMYFENVGVSVVEMLDSVKLTADGKFKFKKPGTTHPEFYRLRLNKQFINVAIDSTETVKLIADAGTFATSYTVEGSESCKAIKDITLAQLDANMEISKLRKAYGTKEIADSTYKSKVLEAAEAYKNVARKYIFSAPMSAAAYFALFQQIDGLLFFDLYDKADSKAYGAVATSYDHFYPESPRSKHLHNLALQSIKVLRGQRPLNLDNIKTEEISFLDIDLPTVTGQNTKLSDLAKGKVVIVNFTAYQAEWSPSLNMELGKVYNNYHDKGLEIYQISLDTDVHFWKNAASNLPWMCVRDPESVYSQAAALYNVKQLPAVFILDKNGNLVKRLDNINNLESSIKSLL
ncbi:MAG: AhpC/TSA family protein [Parabacteroides sp.]|nr:AhpC/TSA family protein [Parabacteroides sp.]